MKYIRLSIIPFMLLIFPLSFISCSSDKTTTDTQKRYKVRMGIAMQPDNVLMILAKELGLFEKHGIDAEYTSFPSGKRALKDGLNKGLVDVAQAADAAFIGNMCDNPQMRILSSTGYAENVNSIIIRNKDQKIDDLKRLRIATQKASAVHYFLYRYLYKHNIKPQQQLQFHKAEKLVSEFKEKRIDAFSMREPYIGLAAKALNDNVTILKSPGLYRQYGLLITSESFHTNNKDALNNIMKALHEAESLYKSKSEEVVSVLKKVFKTDNNTLLETYKFSNIELTLQDPLRILLKAQSSWYERTFLDSDKECKNEIDDFIIKDYMTTLKPNHIFKE